MIELKSLPAYYIERHGRAKVIEVVGREPKIVAMWEKSGAWPLTAVDSLLAFDPQPIHDVKPLYQNPEAGKNIAFLMPLVGAPKKSTWETFARLYDPSVMAYRMSDYNNMSVARNQLAAWALAGGFEQWVWMDGDAIVPCGDAEFFRKASGMTTAPDFYAGMNAINRLRVHREMRNQKATIVSCCYVSRNGSATPQFGGGSLPMARAEVRKGPVDSLKEVPWCGFHFVLTHRSVFEDIITSQGDEIRMDPNGIGKRFGYEYGFFDPLSREFPTEDRPFCERAARAGHKTFVDMAVQAVHIGPTNYSFLNA